jgi:pyruvate/2-oxoglutarate dehydrogenase complex dihydrolipoamide dehydrogenase (E3) component
MGHRECAGSPQFTHIAFDDFRIIRDNLAGGNRVTTGRLIPYCLFTDPELARVGPSETEAKAKGIPYRLVKIPMAADLRTHTLSETRGFMKPYTGLRDAILTHPTLLEGLVVLVLLGAISAAGDVVTGALHVITGVI